MKNFTSFNYKYYRDNLTHTLKSKKRKSKNKAKKFLNKEKNTLEYQVANSIKINIQNELKSILSLNDWLAIIEKENKYLEEENNLINKIKKDVNIFIELDENLQNTARFVLKLMSNSEFYYSNLIPKHFLKDKDFIKKAMLIRTSFLLQIDDTMKNDLDIINHACKYDQSALNYLDISKYQEYVLNNFKLSKQKINTIIKVYKHSQKDN